MMFKRTTLVCLVSLVLGVASASASDKNDCDKDSHYPLITKSELKEVAAKKSAFIVDVNSEDSFKGAHVPGAIHFGSHEKDFTKLLPSDKNALIVSYCGGVKCEAWKKAAQEACNMGYTNIRHFKEGISGWVATK